MNRSLRSRRPEDTRKLGERLGRLLRAGDVILLAGELGAGKTTFVQGLARGMGYAGSVSSKSYVLLGEYAGPVKLYHADLYRLETPEQVQELALEEVCSDGALALEWPERAEEVLPPEHLRVQFEVTGENSRSLRLSANGERARELMTALARRRARAAR